MASVQIKFFVVAILIRNRNNGDHRLQNPPSPLSLPIIGHLHLVSSRPHQSFHNLSTRYGSILQIFPGSFPCVIVSTAEITKEFLKTHEYAFSDRFIKRSAVDYITYASNSMVFAPCRSYWKFMKKLYVSELLGCNTLDHRLPIRREETLRMIMSIRFSKEGDSGGGGLDDSKEIKKMVKNVVELAEKLKNVLDFIWIFKNGDLQGMNKRLKKIRERFDSIMEKVIREHELVKEKGDEDGRVMPEILAEFRTDTGKCTGS
ncbi:hypothetical protein PIB30_099569 [Stylosanthes scabra]|uniref:Uncharacterized protein n=1 Tax=Stylosanthes scabra TaxID=79078 RepID=A0ABU6QX57_9FABA|nr:hypothetical protein [Stylosanthes scabra]